MSQFTYAPQTAIMPLRHHWARVRYGGVLVVWLGLMLVCPNLGLEIYRQRRAESPLRCRKVTRIPSQIAITRVIQAF